MTRSRFPSPPPPLRRARRHWQASPGISAASFSARRREGAGFFPFLVLLTLIFGAGALLFEKFWGENDPRSWQLFGGACACGALAILGWWALSRTRLRTAGSGESTGPLPWLVFPLISLGIVGMVPLLLLAVFPELRVRLDPHNRIEARLAQGKLEILFPESMQEAAVNLQVDDTPIPPALFRERPELAEWRDLRQGDRRILRIDAALLQGKVILPALQPGRRLGVNALRGPEQMLDATGKRLPQQWVEIAGPGT